MKVLITGGTGFVGSYLSREFARAGHEVSIITRSAENVKMLPKGVSVISANPAIPGPWQKSVPEHDLIINLAGASIFTPWTQKARRNILESRMDTTHNVVDALSVRSKETLILSASAVGYYGGHEDDRILDESSPAGDDFLARVGQQWEAEAKRAEDFGVRVILCRFGIVFGAGGGALARMVPIFKKFLGSPLGSGKQWFPWIHEKDLFRIMVFLTEKKDIVGPVNCVSPNPVRNEELTRTLAEVLRRPLIMPSAPKFILRTVLGEFGDVLLKGQRAIPKRLLDEGFDFEYPKLREALRNLLS